MSTEPYFLDLGLDKFEVCCAVQHDGELCENDAQDELCAPHPDGHTFYIPICGENLHRLKAVAAKKHIESGKDPRKLTEINFYGLFLQPKDLHKKCKTTEWNTGSTRLSTAFKLPKIISKKEPVTSTETIKTIKAPQAWKWVDETFKWMDIDGEIKRLSKMSNQHLILTAIALRDENYTSCPKKIAWIKELIKPNFSLQYPEGSLQIGARAAGTKLEEFEEVLASRGFLTALSK